MRTFNKKHTSDFSATLKEFPMAKWAIYAGIAVVGLYVAGNIFRASASCVRGFNEFRASIKGK
jgi:hypothetical protein